MRYDFESTPDRRGTSSLKWDFQQKFAGATGLLPLWVADMDFRAPPEIVEAMSRRVDHGVYGYTLEPESWFQAAAAWLHARHSWPVQRDWLLASPGVIPSLVATILALTDPGDGIIIQPPVYFPFSLRIKANGRTVIENPLVLTGRRWEMDLDHLSRVAEGRARMLVLCSPHNPVGRVWEKQTLERLVEICARHRIVIVSDEIHGDLIMPGFRHIPVASVSAEAAAMTVTLVAPTKTFNLAGMGGSVAIVPDAALRAKVEASHRALFAGVANAVAVAATEAAWRHGGRWLDELLAYLAGNYAWLTSALGERLPAVPVLPLEGTYLPLLDMRGLGLSEEDVRRRLLHTAGVWLEGGSAFGRGAEGFQRINIACPRALLGQAVERVAAAFGAAV
jgi:cystathionine beta-lyase